MPSADFAEMLVGIGAKRIGARSWIAKCPSHEDHSPSLTIYEGQKGQPIFVCGRCDFAEVKAALRERGFKIVAKKKRGEKDRPREEVPAAPAPDYTRIALKLWQQSTRAKGTLVETYLRRRGLISVLTPELLTSVLRFHPSCPRGRKENVEYRPAMIAIMRDIVTDQPVAIHRTFLTDEGGKDGKPMMLGPSLTGAIKLCGKLTDAVDRLCICEGIETGLAAMIRGYRPMWAMGSAGAVERFPVLFWVDHLCVCADHDEKGEAAGIAAMGRWAAAGHHAEFIMPPRVGSDWADYVGIALDG